MKGADGMDGADGTDVSYLPHVGGYSGTFLKADTCGETFLTALERFPL